MNLYKDPFYDNGHADGYCDVAARNMPLATERDRKAYHTGYEQGCLDRLRDIHEDHKFDATNEED